MAFEPIPRTVVRGIMPPSPVLCSTPAEMGCGGKTCQRLPLEEWLGETFVASLFMGNLRWGPDLKSRFKWPGYAGTDRRIWVTLREVMSE
jgi:hypothetical protein